jgi:arylsulfatase A-like enzyme
MPLFRRHMLVMLIATLPLASHAAEATKPNIVLIFADDLGWKDVGYQGAKYFESPNLDALTTRGMVFSNAYAGAGNCAPSRACLLSGQYTPRHGVYAVGDTNRGPKNLMRLIPIPNKSGLAKEQVTMADALKEAGYATGMFGKWHLGGTDGAMPKEQGFDEYIDTLGGGNKPGPKNDPKCVFSLTTKACEFIEKNKDRPFFVYLPHHGIHTPLNARPETLEKFQQKDPKATNGNALYAGCIYDLDASVKQLMDKLDELNLAKNTLVIFTSDNGGTNQSPQEPLRGNKGGYYEGGIREPFIAVWPGVIPPGSVCDVPIHNVDLYPTFLDVAGATPSKETPLDGESLLPLLKGGKALQREAIFWHFPGYLDRPVIRGRDPEFRTRPVSVIRKGDWKLHLYHEEWQLEGGREKLATNNAVELYNLATDIGERTNLANTNTKKRDELLGDLLKWFETTKAPLPTEPNPNYKPGAKQE